MNPIRSVHFAARSIRSLLVAPLFAPLLWAQVEVPAPDVPLARMDLVEDYSEEIANRLIGFSDKLRRRDFDGAKAWLASDFAGRGWAGLGTKEQKALPLGATRQVFDPASAPVVDGDGYLDGLAGVLSPWQRVEWVLYKVKQADFQAGAPPWGKVRFQITFLGTGSDGGPRSVVAWSNAKLVREGGHWQLSRIDLESLQEERRAAPLFTDVATSVGVAHAGIRFGQVGNASFAWNGAAAGDVNGDGLADVFVPSHPANFLYVARAEGGFAEEAGTRGVREPAGGTAAVCFDFDNDGDQDLACTDVGWIEPEGALGGNGLRLWRNDGKGKFTDAASELGCALRSSAFALTAFDAERDGFLDLFVANYGRMEVERNNSWVDATNGMPDQLWSNAKGARFVEVSATRGVSDTRWGYACAAADYDVDGDADVYVANDYAINALWQNRGGGTFRDGAKDAGVEDLGNGMGVAFGDLDSNGSLDLYVANMASTAGNRILKRLSKEAGGHSDLLKMAGGNSIFLSKGNGTFERLPTDKGGVGASWAWAPALFDLDLDGLLDVFCANGFVTGNTPADT